VAYILDTDPITLIEENSQPLLSRLEARLGAHPHEHVFFTIVSFQENTRDWLAYLNKARKDEQILLGYDRLLGVVRRYGKPRFSPSTGPRSIATTNWSGSRSGSARWTCASPPSR
jgi:hypothetical protein